MKQDSHTSQLVRQTGSPGGDQRAMMKEESKGICPSTPVLWAASPAPSQSQPLRLLWFQPSPQMIRVTGLETTITGQLGFPFQEFTFSSFTSIVPCVNNASSHISFLFKA